MDKDDTEPAGDTLNCMGMQHVWETGEAYTGIWWGKPEGKRPLGRRRGRWEDNIKMDLQEVRCGGMDWIELAQGRDRWRALVNAVMYLLVPQNVGNYLTR